MTPVVREQIKAYGRAMFRKGQASAQSKALTCAIYSYLLGIATGVMASLI